MTTIFKYMDYYGVGYFDDPTFRLSRLNELNDPFEADLSSNINKFYDFASKTITDGNGGDVITPLDVQRHIKSAMEIVCIISFSETCRNLLMWAHYSNAHTGICLEVENDWSESKSYLSDKLASDVHRLIRVKYDTVRADFGSFDALSINKWYQTITKIFVSQLSVKSDEWIYEKEHRYIMTLLETDLIKTKKGAKVSKEVSDKLKLDVKKEYIALNNDDYITDRESSEESIYTSLDSDAFMYLRRIPPRKIKSIYLGHRFSSTERVKILTKISNPDHPLHHVTLYQYTISSDRFELEPTVIHTKKA